MVQRALTATVDSPVGAHLAGVEIAAREKSFAVSLATATMEERAKR